MAGADELQVKKLVQGTSETCTDRAALAVTSINDRAERGNNSMRHGTSLMARTGLLFALWFLAPAPPLQADFCDDVCFPTCDDWEARCVADGGECGTLCSCDYIYGRCEMCECNPI